MSKLSTVIAAALLIAAGAASAQTTEASQGAALTREAVIAELATARTSGELATIQGEKGVEVTTPASAKAAAVATSKLPRQAILTVKPTEVRSSEQVAADHGENAARELGDFPAPVGRRASAMASR